jgi:hypothetical protein
VQLDGSFPAFPWPARTSGLMLYHHPLSRRAASPVAD